MENEKQKENENFNEGEETSQNDGSDQEATLKNKRNISDLSQKHDEKEDLQKESVDWSSSSTEHEFEGFVHPSVICIGQMVKHITENEIKDFFINIAEVTSVKLQPPKPDGEMQALVFFETDEEAQAALSLNGKDLLGKSVYITRCSKGLLTLCVTGFNSQLTEDDILEEVFHQLSDLEPKWEVEGHVFLPKSVETDSNLGLFYLIVKPPDDTDWTSHAVYEYFSGKNITVSDAIINIYKADLRAWVLRSIMDGDIPNLQGKIAALRTSIEENSQRIYDKEEPFSWREIHPEFFSDYIQLADECWAVILYRGYFAAFFMENSRSCELDVCTIIKGVDARYKLSGGGIVSMDHAKPFMLEHARDLKFHHRPKKNHDERDFEAFEKRIIGLARRVPVGTMLDFLPSMEEWDGNSIFVPTEIDLIRKFLEKLPYHGYFVSGIDSENGIDFWKGQDSGGRDFGDQGFVRIARHYRLIKQVFEFTV
ncbi:uncharacterized protein LOC17875615 isoform X2 [Capsella rubella]|uniref:uncharacterized protein LOC17875615 isoform X2 n=1 Tax=Capsella rubella TaxID=81985 RepID=UPI000CD5A88C|nr:uncharacterized protein LOC17875615 isoform X2 [Capsella rubella]